ncbi:MAG: tetratricopeptide repeat protein [Pseudomonadales bacterium]|nr:tetratricopeptide repeat protein [Pseudomonadales bacterium]
MSAMFNIQRIDEREGDYSRSLELFEAAHEKDPNEIATMLVLARIYKAKGENERSLAMVNKAYQLDPNALMPNLLLAAAALAARDYVAMEQYATTAISNHPQSARAQALMGVTQLRRSEFKAAIESFTKALEIEPDEFMYHYHLANAQLGSSQLAQARDSYARALELNPSHLASIRSLAVLEVRAKNTARADELLKLAAAQHGEQNAQVLELVADVRAIQGRPDEALAAFEQAQALQATWPRAAKMYQLRANNKMPDPTAPLQAWVDKTPGDATARLMLAQGYQRLQENARAIEQYEAVLKLRPDAVLARNNLAWLYMESGGAGSLKRARDQAAQAFELAGDNPDVADTYGWILFRIGEADKGIEILRQAVAAAGPQQSPDIAYHLAAALNETGATTEARELLTQALQSGAKFASRADAQRLFDTL